jgi:hypothetical protein
MEKLYDKEYVHRVWENIEENIKTSAKEGLVLYELKQRKLWFDEECSRILGQRSRLKCNGYRIKTKTM